MATKPFLLELLESIILETQDRPARIEIDIRAIKDRLDAHQDELNVVSGVAMRGTGERIA